MQIANAFIPRRSRERSQITGYGRPRCHRNVGYAAKRAKICIHGKGGVAVNRAQGAFLWMTRRSGPAPERTTKFAVTAEHRH